MSHLPPRYELITAAIPQAWVARIDALCEAVGQTRSEWLYDRIVELVGPAASDTSGAEYREAIAALTARLAALEATVACLHRPDPQSSLTPAEPQTQRPQPQSAQTARSEPTADEEDDIDEPDEVLWSFLSPTAGAAPPPAAASGHPQPSSSADDDIEDEPYEILDGFL